MSIMIGQQSKAVRAPERRTQAPRRPGDLTGKRKEQSEAQSYAERKEQEAFEADLERLVTFFRANRESLRELMAWWETVPYDDAQDDE